MARDFYDYGVSFQQWVGRKSPTRKWVNCPICGDSDTRAELEPGEEDYWVYYCTNLACRSNGGDYDEMLEISAQQTEDWKSAAEKLSNEVAYWKEQALKAFERTVYLRDCIVLNILYSGRNRI